MIVIGIDPGQSGGIGVIDTFDRSAWAISMPETETDLATEMRAMVSSRTAVVYIERVSAMPKQGVSSTFKFGVGYGLLQGVTAALEIRRTFVLPRTWQSALCCLSGGDKNVTKRRAQELFPDLKITHAIADALLIAEYGRRVECGMIVTNLSRPKHKVARRLRHEGRTGRLVASDSEASGHDEGGTEEATVGAATKGTRAAESSQGTEAASMKGR